MSVELLDRVTEFANRLEQKLVAGLNADHNKDKAFTYGVDIEISTGKRYFKITKGSGIVKYKDKIEDSKNFQQSVYAFIDKKTGDIMKPASWAAPAKHARGNILADDFGLSCCGTYGVAYMR